MGMLRLFTLATLELGLMTGNGCRAIHAPISHLTRCKEEVPRANQGRSCSSGPWVGASWYPYHLPAIQPEPSTWGTPSTWTACLGMLYLGCLLCAGGNKGDAVDVCIPEGGAGCPEPWLFTASGDHRRTKAAQVFLVQ